MQSANPIVGAYLPAGQESDSPQRHELPISHSATAPLTQLHHESPNISLQFELPLESTIRCPRKTICWLPGPDPIGQ